MSTSSKHVAVTGIGMITPLGITANECWNNLVEGKSGIHRITRFSTEELLTQIGGEIPPEYFQAEQHLFSSDVIERMIFPIRLAVYVVNLAIEDSGISRKVIQNSFTGVITGSGGSVYNDDVMFKSKDADRVAGQTWRCWIRMPPQSAGSLASEDRHIMSPQPVHLEHLL